MYINNFLEYLIYGKERLTTTQIKCQFLKMFRFSFMMKDFQDVLKHLSNQVIIMHK